MPPILYIGLGSSGLRMLEEAQRFFYSTTNETCSPLHTRFLFIETDANMKRSNIPGPPADRPAIEAFPTILRGVGVHRNDLEKKATVRIRYATDPPNGATVVFEMRDRTSVRKTLDEKTFPEQLYTKKPTVFTRQARTLTDSAFEHISLWLRNIGLKDGTIAVRLIEEKLEVFIPSSVPKKIALRIEILFNEIELATRLETRKKQSSQSGDEENEIEVVRWLPSQEVLTRVGDAGAGGMRNVGRIALWRPSHLGTTGNNIYGLKNKISGLVNQLQAACGGGLPLVYIVGTFAGGTNSGMFIDVAYLCRDVLDPTRSLQPEILGLFLLPKPDEMEVALAANAYACLRDLNHFNAEGSQFLANWPCPDGLFTKPFGIGETPFKLVTLMSSSWVMGGDLDKLTRMAGLFLYLNGTEFGNYRNARTVDVPIGGGALLPWKFSAVGLSGYFYPRGEIRVTSACDAAVEGIFNSLISDRCEGLPEPKPAIATALSARFPDCAQLLEEALERCFDRIANRGPGGQDVFSRIDDFIGKASKHEVDFDEKTIKTLLWAEGEIYKLAKTTASEAIVDILQGAINGIISTEINETGNVNFGVAVAKSIATHLDKVIVFWESLRLGEWDPALLGTGELSEEAILQQVHEDRHGWSLRRKALREARFRDAIRLMSIHLLTPHIRTLRNELRQTEVAREDALRYPDLLSAAKLGRLIFLVNAASAKVQHDREVIARGIAQGIHPNDPFRYVFPRGSFQGEVDEALNAFRNTGPQASGSLISGFVQRVQRGSLLDALRKFEGDNGSLSDEAVKYLTDQLHGHDLPQFPANTSLEDYLEGGPLGVRNLAAMAAGSKSITLKAEIAFRTTPRHPRVVLTDSPNKSITIANSLTDLVFNPTGSGQSSTPALKDMVVFFDEAHLNSLTDMEAYGRWQTGYDQNSPIGTLDAYLLT